MKTTSISSALLLGSILISSCAPPEAAIQTAIASTADAISSQELPPTATIAPTSTKTAAPTSTPTPTSTPVPIGEWIIGKWSGAMTNSNGDKIPAFWSFLDGGVMLVEIPLADVSYGAEWRLEGTRLHITTELDPENPTYRDVEFVSEDLMILTKDESGIRETWMREQAATAQ